MRIDMQDKSLEDPNSKIGSLIFSSISPYAEMIAYETLWAIDGMTESKLSELFSSNNALPSSVLDQLKKSSKQLSFEQNTSDISVVQEKVRKFIEPKLGTFSIVVNRDFQYPIDLRSAKHPIELFYYKGNLDLLSSKSISIVGARAATPKGLNRASRLSAELVEEGFTIVSGLAAGIDTAALTSAISSGGNVIGVIGTPIDAYYPKENRALQDDISENHLLISQVPFYRYATETFRNHRQYFPRRNVTMASISKATVIVEASDTSGSLTQARACVAQKKPLFILDSCFSNSDITWPSHYEKNGAIRVKETADIVGHLQ